MNCGPQLRSLASGYRRYQTPDIARLRFVQRAKVLDLTLDEIRELLALSDHRDEDMGELKAAATANLTDIKARLSGKEITNERKQRCPH